jgi:hypothetical protein
VECSFSPIILSIMMQHRVFLLSPANAGGQRARMLLSPTAGFELAHRLQRDSAPIGEVFAFVSGLYFRGKLAYAERFANAPPGAPSTLVITPGRGLMSADTCISAAEFRDVASVPVERAEPGFQLPFMRDAHVLARNIPTHVPVVLLGSIATAKYVATLLEVFGERLLFPYDFVGRGDMSRGGLMLRSARSGEELGYAPVLNAVRRGARPPRLPGLPPQGGGATTR